MKILKRVGAKIWLGVPGTVGIEMSLTPKTEAELAAQGIEVPPDGYHSSVAVGRASTALGSGVALGRNAFADDGSVAIGDSAYAGSGSVAIGAGAVADVRGRKPSAE